MIAVDSDIEAWLRLSLVRGLGNATIIRLLRRFQSPEAILAADPSVLSHFLSPTIIAALKQGPATALIDATLRWLSAPNHYLLTLADSDYPRSLLAIDSPPVVFYLWGRRDLLAKQAIAIVGSRQATAQGLANAKAFARYLGERDYCVASGLALGVDSAAHQGALATSGSTIAVIATGPDRVYPSCHQPLVEEIAGSGAIISEFPLGTLPKPGHFPRRNRIISGLSQAVLVVEANLRSGSLITARQALQQGRDVFAIPGSIHSPLTKGCHALIKQGAKLVESGADILDELAPMLKNQREPRRASDTQVHDAPQDLLLAALGFDPVGIDTLCSYSHLPLAQVQARLLALELVGEVIRLDDGRYQRFERA